ncbi:MAG: hypothetical protein B7Y59_12660 [Burkholderiales bacterium 35-55-47]|nr:MAG: hypothetical protein B7Y59_12660 [Burkholderiales bacterium 35-55-47]
MAHGRHVWGGSGNMNAKGNKVLIDGWSLFCQRNPSIKKTLVFIEYGPDVIASKKYIANLGLESTVSWLPLMYRKDLMAGLSMADIVAAEFIQSWICGGIIYEALVMGKPLIMHSDEHKNPAKSANLYPIYNARTPEAIAGHLQQFVVNPDSGRNNGIAGHTWYLNNVVNKAISMYANYLINRASELGKIAR